tara:strand:- start:109 stop:750 length:642 start_codon:yes stop_codon:yes gene_type:complete
MALVKYNNNSISAVTSAASIPSGAMTHIKTLTASSSSTVSFVDGSGGVVLDSTYPIYKFEFINIHPSTNHTDFKFNMSTDSGSNYNVTKTTTFFVAYHSENGSASALQYSTGSDLAQSTSDQTIAYYVSNDNDGSASGELYLFNPSSTTFVKHFLARANGMYKDTGDGNSPYTHDFYNAGYGNTTSAVDAIIFRMSSGNIDSGTIKLYGIKDS